MFIGVVLFLVGFFGFGENETTEKMSKERGLSDTESFAFQVKVGLRLLRLPNFFLISLHMPIKGELNLWTMEIQQPIFPYYFLTYFLSILQSK